MRAGAEARCEALRTTGAARPPVALRVLEAPLSAESVAVGGKPRERKDHLPVARYARRAGASSEIPAVLAHATVGISRHADVCAPGGRAEEPVAAKECPHDRSVCISTNI